jgi:hypothetical protein
MGKTPDEPPLTMADLERVRADLRLSIRHTEELLARTETLLTAVALIAQGKSLSRKLPDVLVVAPDTAGTHALRRESSSTN